MQWMSPLLNFAYILRIRGKKSSLYPGQVAEAITFFPCCAGTACVPRLQRYHLLWALTGYLLQSHRAFELVLFCREIVEPLVTEKISDIGGVFGTRNSTA
jgi:hypothetical protein